MDFGERLINVRKERGYTRESLANALGISKYTLRNYELGATEPGHTFLKQISDFFHVSIDYLMGLTNEPEILESFNLNTSEQDILNKYRNLDDHGKKVVDFILNEEYSRRNILAPTQFTKNRLVQYFQRFASAGSGQLVFDDVPVDLIEIPDVPEFKDVRYAIGVNGQSMEPLYYDGDILLVKPADDVAIGDIGIFIVDGQSYVKKRGENCLISLNEDYAAIPLDESSSCLGKVIGKLNI